MLELLDIGEYWLNIGWNNVNCGHLVDEGGEEGVLCSLQVQLFHLWLPIFIFMLIIKAIMVIRVIIVIMVIMVIIMVILDIFFILVITLRPVLQTKLSSAPHLVKIFLQTSNHHHHYYSWSSFITITIIIAKVCIWGKIIFKQWGTRKKSLSSSRVRTLK